MFDWGCQGKSEKVGLILAYWVKQVVARRIAQAQSAQLCRPGLPAQAAQDPPGAVSGATGCLGALVQPGSGDLPPLSQRWEGTQALSPVSGTVSPLSAPLSTLTIDSSVNLLLFILQSSVLFILPENSHSYWYSFRGKCQNSKPNHRTWVLILPSMVGPASLEPFNKWSYLAPVEGNGGFGVAFDAVILAVTIEDLGQPLVQTSDF